MRRALILVNESFEDRLPPLRSPVADGQALADVLRAPDIGAYDVTLVPDPECREAKIALERFMRAAEPDATVLLALSSHGISDRGFHYVPADGDPNFPLATCLSGDFIRYLMDDCVARRQVLLIDCCHSGGIVGDGGAAKSLGAGGVDVASLEGEGRAILASSRADQRSFEIPTESGNSTSSFTRAVVEGLRTGDADEDRDGVVMLSELYRFVTRRVHASGNPQTPTLSTRGVAGDIPIASVPLRRQRVSTIPEDLVDALANPYQRIRMAAITEIGRLVLSPLDERMGQARALLREVVRTAGRVEAAHAAAQLRQRRKLGRGAGTPASAGPASAPWFITTGAALRQAISTVEASASTDRHRPTLQTISVELTRSGARCVATDSYRLTEATFSLSRGVTGPHGVALVRADELGALHLDGDKEVRVFRSAATVEIESDGNVALLPTVDAERIVYEGLFPSGKPTWAVTGSADAIASGIEDAVSGEHRGGPIYLEVRNSTLSVRVVGTERAVPIDAPVGGRDGQVALNPTYLIEGLAPHSAAEVTLAFWTDSRPIVLTAPRTRYMQMPVRVR